MERVVQVRQLSFQLLPFFSPFFSSHTAMEKHPDVEKARALGIDPAWSKQDSQPSTWSRALRSTLKLSPLLLLFTWFTYPIFETGHHKHSPPSSTSPSCKQVEALWPASDSDALKESFEYLSSPGFEKDSIARLSGAVQIATESYDDLGKIGEDKRWDSFYPFHDYLKATFPRIHEKLKLEKVNTHGLLYTWHGSDEGRKPVVLMAHQDVVPVDKDTVDSWTFPPYSGHFDGTNIWGRGASDCKNSLIGILETVEVLLNAGYKPKRTIVLSFGFDEESSGREGAGHLSKFLHERYGDDGVAAIVDEGMGYTEAFGRGYAVPGVAEKASTKSRRSTEIDSSMANDLSIGVHRCRYHSSHSRRTLFYPQRSHEHWNSQ